MGYRTTIKNINSVGHLIEGNVYTFFQQSLASDEMLKTNIDFLDTLIRRTSEQFYMSKKYWEYLEYDLNYLRREWNHIRHSWIRSRTYFEEMQHNFFTLDKKEDIFFQGDERILGYLKIISRLFSRCRVKSILLPGFDYKNKINELLTRKDTLERIIKIHPGDTALILQFEEQFDKEDKAILNVFPKFEKALYQFDSWPGVFFWNNDDSIFLPINSERELYELYRIIRYEENYFSFLRNRYKKEKKQRRHAYILHMSDLHFGHKIAERRKPRVVRLLANELENIEDDATVVPIITGDLMDSPSLKNKQSYGEFFELLHAKGYENPVHILGNHDVDTRGILKLLTNQKAIISSLSSNSKIAIFEELKLVLIKFDSNTGGSLAQGRIGEDQLIEVGNEIDALPEKDKYTFIALLHHHPLEIENPTWYAREWYESLFGTKEFEKTMKLVDSELFLKWIQQRGIKYILHGHKHIPKVQKYDDITVVAAGSATGCVKHRDKEKTYLSYNLIKYDIDSQAPVSISIVAEEIIGAGPKNMLLHLI